MQIILYKPTITPSSTLELLTCNQSLQTWFFHTMSLHTLFIHNHITLYHSHCHCTLHHSFTVTAHFVIHVESIHTSYFHSQSLHISHYTLVQNMFITQSVHTQFIHYSHYTLRSSRLTAHIHLRLFTYLHPRLHSHL